MTHPNRRATAADIEARRRKVASALLAGADSFTAIAEQLDVSVATISRDVKVIEAQWQEEAFQDISAAKGRDLKRTDRLIGAMWSKALGGDERAAKMVLDLMQHRAKLLGLNAPERRELTGANGGPIQHQDRSVADVLTREEIDRIAAEVRRKDGGASGNSTP